MIRRRHNDRFARWQTPRRSKKRRGITTPLGSRFHVERLEDRYLLSASTLQTASEPVFDAGVLIDNMSVSYTLAGGSVIPPWALGIGTSPPPPQDNTTELQLAGGAATPTPPFPLADTFVLNSFPSATKTIYLDFDGFTTRNTPWNADFQANIVTIPYDFDDNFVGFSDLELIAIQKVWQRVSEDFRPFQVNVTTQDPGTDALSNSGGADDTWGVRVAIGGSTQDWYTPVSETAAGGVAHLNSFTSSIDDPVFAFAGDFGNKPDQIAEVVSHEVGHSLGLNHDGQIRYWIEAESGEIHDVALEYYPGHPTPALVPGATTNWAPIMGVAYNKYLTQWGQGEYPNATNIEDDLAIITTLNGFDYRADDHGNSNAEAVAMVEDPLTSSEDTSIIVADGIIERNTDVDWFSFAVEALGELVSFDIQPYSEGPNLDILAKLYKADGTLIATSNDIDTISARFNEIGLLPGSYYVSIQGDGRPITYIDPIAHPGPVPDDESVPDGSDWGYSNYGSLGYYKITGTRKKSLVVGVDFDVAGGASPTHWTLYSGGTAPAVLTNLVSEAGAPVPYELSISSSGANITSHTSPVIASDLPDHGVPLNELGGYISTSTDTWTFEWSNLEPWSYHQVYVFGHADVNVSNQVTIVGGNLNGTIQTIPFTQTIDPLHLVVNDLAQGQQELSTYAFSVLSDASGKIAITVGSGGALPTGLAGLAIAPTRPIGPPQPGSISGQKWNDLQGDRVHSPGEVGLPGWVIYLDENDNGQLDLISTPDQTVTTSSPNVPQVLQDYATTKNDLVFAESGAITDVNVTLDISHTYDADLNVYLISPSGTKVKLFADIGNAGDNFHLTVLDDEAVASITSGSAPFTGTYRPQELLSAFDGEDPQGTWQLEVRDDATGDTGVLNSWSITVSIAGVTTYLEPYATTDSNGDYTFANLQPGLYHVREHFQPDQLAENWVQTLAPTPITVTSGADIVGVDFGNWQPVTMPGSIQGVVFNDGNGNGAKDGAEQGLEGWIVYLDADNDGVRDITTSPTTIPATDLPKPILDFSNVNSTVEVSGTGTLFSVEVTLDITHSFTGDLEAYLIAPSGNSVKLFSHVGGQYNNFSNLTLSDSASLSISTIGFDDLPYTGTWRPEGLLSALNGETVHGFWTLQIRDTAFADQGTLNSWSLKVISGEVFRTTDADGNYAFADLPAGSYVVREENQAGWSLVPPSVTSIPAASWSGSQWNVAVSGVDNPADPNGPDSQRNVKNVNFGNSQAATTLAGDYDRTGVVDARDYVLWRKTLGTPVGSPFDGADGNGNSLVDAADHTVWQAHYGNSTPGSGSLALAASGLLDTPLANTLVTEASGTENSTPATVTNRVVDFVPYQSAAPRLSSRPAYRPATSAATTSDQALLAWLAATGDEDRNEPDTVDNAAPTGDTESVDFAFETLEAAILGADRAV